MQYILDFADETDKTHNMIFYIDYGLAFVVEGSDNDDISVMLEKIATYLQKQGYDGMYTLATVAAVDPDFEENSSIYLDCTQEGGQPCYIDDLPRSQVHPVTEIEIQEIWG